MAAAKKEERETRANEAAWICNAYFNGERDITPPNIEAALCTHISRLIMLQKGNASALVCVQRMAKDGKKYVDLLSSLDELEKQTRAQLLRYKTTRVFLLQANDFVDLVVTADSLGTEARVFFRLDHSSDVAQYGMSFNPFVNVKSTRRTYSLAIGSRPAAVSRLAPRMGDSEPLSTSLVGQLLIAAQHVHPRFGASDAQRLAERLTRNGWKPEPHANLSYSDICYAGPDAEDEGGDDVLGL